MKKMKVTGQVPGETKEIRVKKVPKTTQTIPCTLIEKGSGEITISSHVEEAKEPVAPKTVRVRTISEPKKTVTVRVVDVKKVSDSPRAGRKGKTK